MTWSCLRILRGTLLTVGWLGVSNAAGAATPAELWEAWPKERFVPTAAPCLRHADLVERLGELRTRHAAAANLTIEEVGKSVQGRAIHLLTVGSGPRKVLLWSQMHGDEPSATPALLDLADYVLRHSTGTAADELISGVLEKYTLLLVPMLNPDGAEVYSRRNAQAIDINRDALNLATPEGRLLKQLRDQHQPVLGFNLHDQNRRRTVGDTGVRAVNAILAVTGDRERTLTEGRILAKRAGVAVAAAIEPYARGGMARYDEEWSPRAFGDNLTAWGTPILLIESGGPPGNGPLSELTRLNFVGILAALQALADSGLAEFHPSRYDAIPENNADVWTDVIVSGGELLQPGSGAAYRGDLAFDLLQGDRVAMKCPGAPSGAGAEWSRIIEVGDARIFSSARLIDATDRVLLAPFTVGLRGAKAGKWLNAAAARRLSRLGVARVIWTVDSRGFAEALEVVEGLGKDSGEESMPEIEVVSGDGELPPIVLERLPREAPAAELSGMVASLLEVREKRSAKGGVSGAAESGGSISGSAFEELWGGNRPMLRPDETASFLILAPEEGQAIEPDQPVVVESVWLDGRTVDLRAR